MLGHMGVGVVQQGIVVAVWWWVGICRRAGFSRCLGLWVWGWCSRVSGGGPAAVLWGWGGGGGLGVEGAVGGGGGAARGREGICKRDGYIRTYLINIAIALELEFVFRFHDGTSYPDSLCSNTGSSPDLFGPATEGISLPLPIFISFGAVHRLSQCSFDGGAFDGGVLCSGFDFGYR
ncbi:hypothetical protein U1Q18_043836 [Sarracenia purpurea var. burkii]